MIFYLAVILISIVSCYKWGDWKNWKIYHPTILFFIAADITQEYVTIKKPLWEYYSPPISDVIINLMIAFLVYSTTVLLYLPKFPHKFHMQVFHVMKWIFIYSFLEYLAGAFGLFIYSNGWNYWYSVLFNCIIFLTLFLHHKKPLLAYLTSTAIAVIMIYYFKIPTNF